MNRSIDLSPEQRQALLDRYRKDPDPEVRFRAHILLLLADGHTWATVCTLLFCSSPNHRPLGQAVRRGGVEGLAGHKPGRPFRLAASWVAVVVEWVTTQAPRDFGFLRSRWCCEAVALLMLREHDVEVSRETVRRWLHRGGPGLPPPAPGPRPDRRQREARLDDLRKLLAGLPDDETAVFQDEVDINTNPKIGSMWMVKGQQAKVETPGNNEKRYLSGSIHWRTGQVFLTEGKPKQGRDTALVPGPPGRLAGPAAALPQDPRHLRPGEVPHQRGGGDLPVRAPRPDRPAPAAGVQPGLQPDRACVVAPCMRRSPATIGASRCRSCWT